MDGKRQKTKTISRHLDLETKRKILKNTLSVAKRQAKPHTRSVLKRKRIGTGHPELSVAAIAEPPSMFHG